MKNTIKALFFYLFISSALAGNQEGKVIDLRVSEIQTFNPTHFKLEEQYYDKPACATQPYWAIDTSTDAGKSFLSVLLTAYSTGKKVQVWGNGQCNLRPDMETALQIALPQQ